MKRILTVLLCTIVLIVAVGVFVSLSLRKDKSGTSDPAAADEQTQAANAAAQQPGQTPEPTNAPIVRLQLFKNGFGFVTREIPPRKWSKPLVLKPAVTPRHGTLWFEPADTAVRRTAIERVVTDPAAADNDAPGYRPDWSSMTDAYEWKQVTLKLKSGPELSGVVVGNQKPQTDDRPQQNIETVIDPLSSYRSSSSSVRSYSSSGLPVAAKSPFGAGFLTIRTEDGDYITVRQDDVARIRAKSMSDGTTAPVPKKTVTEEVQLVEAPKDHRGPVRMRYLSEGVTWAPFYRVELGDGGKLTINTSATVLNDLEDFENVEVELISGFPNMVFASSLSAISKGMTLQKFLNNLANPSSPSYLRSGGSSVMSQAVFSNSAPQYDEVPSSIQQASLWTASGMDDMQYKSAGKLTMKKGDVLQLPIASASADFEYVTTWTAPMEKRFSFGESSGDATLWNCIRFRNPFDFALTTAPYEIEQNGQVLGQSTGTWFGAGDPATIKITKSMAVSASITQVESGNQNRYFTENRGFSEYKYHYPDVTANIVLANRSPKDVRMVVESTFFGELISADGEPSKVPQPTDNRTRNAKTKLVWEVVVPASGKLELDFTYKVILDN